jgi:hypothetical protein
MNQLTGAELTMIVGLIANLLGVLTIAWKMSRFIAQIETKVDLMWIDFKNRNEFNRRHREPYHERANDESQDE